MRHRLENLGVQREAKVSREGGLALFGSLQHHCHQIKNESHSHSLGLFRLFAVLVLSLGIVACNGDDDDDEPGPPGAPAGVDVNNAQTINAEIIAASVASPPVVDFKLTDGNGNPVRNLPADSISFNFAQLLPGTDGNASAWQSYINQIESPGVGPGTESQVQATTESGSEGTLQENADGTYRYTFATDVTNVTDPIPVSYLPQLTHRVSFEIRGFVPVENPAFDFRPSDGATDSILSRDIVKTATCNVCHEELALHGGGRLETKQCVTCHNPGSTDANSGNVVDMKVMIHKIHAGENLPSVIGGRDYCIYGFGDNEHCYGDVVYPQDIRNCANCHDADDPQTPDAANWYTVPTAEACGSCHDNVNFSTGEGHAENDLGLGIAVDNSQCATCHATNANSRIEVRQAHRILTQEQAARYSLDILGIDFGGGPGSSPMVNFSVSDPTNGGQPYDLALDPVLSDPESGLRFYMGWPTADYTNEGSGSEQGQPPERTELYNDDGMLNATEIDPGVYQLALSPIPPAATGSGAVSFEGRLESAVGRLPVTTAVDFFPITDVPAIPRRQKVDVERCDNCHQLLSEHGNNRNDNIDACVICHNSAFGSTTQPLPDDTLTNFSDDFKVLIHRVHGQVRYPQRLSNCTACHTDEGFYPVSAGSGVLATTIFTGADPVDQSDDVNITPNAAACSVCHGGDDARIHMEQNGGSFDACQAGDGTIRHRIDLCGAGGTLGPLTQESCTVCHGPGRVADVATVHGVE